ncbi:sugar porter family MFS transporter [Sciscionella sediminilitoris]|uniref:sugar porter family MFS transporter n=1 Tax=Sciscionella sediminilitoris TaxID=1445613 RepID=UPI000689E840|nr:sugar porter family MFS transporter [Sciscionella sp. SE31]
MAEKPQGGGNRAVYVAASICAIGALLFGYDTGVISGAMLYLKGPLGIADAPFMQGLVTSVLLVGAVVGALASGSLAVRFGRRPVALLAACVFVLGALGAALSADAWMLVGFRVVLGLGVGSASVIVPMYIAEIAPARIRGSLTSLNQLLIAVGILLSYIVNYLLAPAQAWRWMIGLAGLPAVVLFIGMLFMPESPRWLVSKGRMEDAERTVQRLRSADELEEGRAELHAAVRDSQESLGWRALTGAWIRRALIIGIGLAVLQQFVGINTILYYAPSTLTQLGLGDSASIAAQMGNGVIMVVATLVAVRYADRLGRRRLLLTGSFGMAVSLGVLGVLTLIVGASGQWIAVVTIVCLAVYVAAFGATWGPIMWVMLPELYPLHVRGPAEAVASCANWAANFVVSLVFPVVVVAIGQGTTMLIFACFGVVSFFFVRALVPETAGQSLESTAAVPSGADKEGTPL